MTDTTGSPLPPTHVFITLAHRRGMKTFALPRWFVATAVVGAGVAGLWLIASTLYVAGHDSLLAGLMNRERAAQFVYEDRIASLQRELDRSLSQHARLERTVAAKLETLTAQEADLRRNAGMVATLAEEFRRVPGRIGTAAAAVPTAAPAPLAPARSADGEGGGEPRAKRLGARVTALFETFGALASAQTANLSTLQAAVDGELARYHAAFDEAGLSTTRFGKGSEATGGPFVPLDAGRPGSPFERASLSLKATLAEAERLGGLVSRIPFAKPLEGSPEITSPFGARIDPFLGRPALHTGIDIRDEIGTVVRATAPGRVTVAGPASGYGVMVEIDHGNGLTTRYGHLSAIAVTVGESVAPNEIVGEVGSTGRATGPHLHYETRIDGEPVDPMRFLTAGARLYADNAAAH